MLFWNWRRLRKRTAGLAIINKFRINWENRGKGKRETQINWIVIRKWKQDSFGWKGGKSCNAINGKEYLIHRTGT